MLSIKNCLLYSIQLHSRSVVNMSTTYIEYLYTKCSFRNFQCKYLENNAFSGKILNTKVSQFRGGNKIFYLFFIC